MEENKKRNYYLTTEDESLILMQGDLKTFDELTSCFKNRQQLEKYIRDKYLINFNKLKLMYNSNEPKEMFMIFKNKRQIVDEKTRKKIIDWLNYRILDENKIIDNLCMRISKPQCWTWRKIINEGTPIAGSYGDKIIKHLESSYLDCRKICSYLSDINKINFRSNFEATKGYVENIINNKLIVNTKNPIFDKYKHKELSIDKKNDQITISNMYPKSIKELDYGTMQITIKELNNKMAPVKNFKDNICNAKRLTAYLNGKDITDEEIVKNTKLDNPIILETFGLQNLNNNEEKTEETEMLKEIIQLGNSDYLRAYGLIDSKDNDDSFDNNGRSR
ncbi:MAG: hypothetical protein WC917_03180 [Bacilli bacterium]|jgi:hypothetical protein